MSRLERQHPLDRGPRLVEAVALLADRRQREPARGARRVEIRGALQQRRRTHRRADLEVGGGEAVEPARRQALLVGARRAPARAQQQLLGHRAGAPCEPDVLGGEMGAKEILIKEGERQEAARHGLGELREEMAVGPGEATHALAQVGRERPRLESGERLDRAGAIARGEAAVAAAVGPDHHLELARARAGGRREQIVDLPGPRGIDLAAAAGGDPARGLERRELGAREPRSESVDPGPSCAGGRGGAGRGRGKSHPRLAQGEGAGLPHAREGAERDFARSQVEAGEEPKTGARELLAGSDVEGDAVVARRLNRAAAPEGIDRDLDAEPAARVTGDERRAVELDHEQCRNPAVRGRRAERRGGERHPQRPALAPAREQRRRLGAHAA